MSEPASPRPSGAPVVRVAEVSIRRDGRAVLEEISFEVLSRPA
jgi:hypothetical protein